MTTAQRANNVEYYVIMFICAQSAFWHWISRCAPRPTRYKCTAYICQQTAVTLCAGDMRIIEQKMLPGQWTSADRAQSNEQKYTKKKKKQQEFNMTEFGLRIGNMFIQYKKKKYVMHKTKRHLQITEAQLLIEKTQCHFFSIWEYYCQAEYKIQ